MTARGTDNLRGYLRETMLPSMTLDARAPNMPPPGHKSHQNHLKTVRPEAWRRLESIYPFASISMDDIVISWIDSHIPCTSLGVEDEDSLTGERITIPCPPVFNIPFHNERRPTDIMRLSPWLDNLPLMTVQRIMHLLYPETRRWGFSLNDDNDSDRKIFQYFVWSLPAPEEGIAPAMLAEIGRKSIVVAFQPPWILSEQDIKEFSQCRSFPPYRLPGNAFPTGLESKERLWAKIWDACVSRKTPWFVLTSYNQWVFGVFSAGWTAAFVSGVHNFDSLSPTIIEWLTFWVASAMRLQGLHAIPKVPEPVTLGPVLIPPTNANFATPANSESNWDGKDHDAASSARARSMSPVLSDGGLPGLVEQQPILLEMVQQWMQNRVDSNGAAPNIVRRAPSPVGDDTFEQPLTYQGDWLV